jgi:hypothetical protein
VVGVDQRASHGRSPGGQIQPARLGRLSTGLDTGVWVTEGRSTEGGARLTSASLAGTKRVRQLGHRRARPSLVEARDDSICRGTCPAVPARARPSLTRLSLVMKGSPVRVRASALAHLQGCLSSLATSAAPFGYESGTSDDAFSDGEVVTPAARYSGDLQGVRHRSACFHA